MRQLIRTNRLVGMGLIVLLAVVSILASPDWKIILFLSFLWLVLTANFEIMGGFLGYVTLAQGAFFGLGAYVSVILINTLNIPIVGIPTTQALAIMAAGVASGIFAVLLSFPLFRLRGIYFIIGTLVLVFLLQHLALNLSGLTGGSYGLFLPPDYFLSLSTACSVAFVLALISLGFNYYLSRSKLGLALTSIREDEEAAASLGLNTMRYKIGAFVLSSVPSGAAGAIFALNSGFIDVGNSLNVLRSLIPALMALVGGTGVVLGAVFGVLIIRAIDVAFFHYILLPISPMIFYGVILLVVALFMPEGLLNSLYVIRIMRTLRNKILVSS